ncbi:uncharacterized protein LOC144692831 [Cetorhinus maximus]
MTHGDVGKVPTCDLFLLNSAELVNICCLLVGTVEVNKDTKQGGSNLYDELYLTLHFLLLKIIQRGRPKDILMGMVSKWNLRYKWYCNFLALETVLLFAVVPDFYEYIGKNSRVNNLLSLATGDSDFVTEILEVLRGRNSQETGVEKLLEQASQLVIQKVHDFYCHKRAHNSKYKREHQFSLVLKASNILPQKSVAEFFQTSENLHQGIRSLPHKKSSIKCPDESEMTCKIPADTSSPVTHQEFNAGKHYIYMDLRQLEWDEVQGYWKPQIAIGNRFTSWLPGEEVNDDLNSTYGGTTGTEETHAKPKITKRLKKQSAAVKSGTKSSQTYLQPFTATYKQTLLDEWVSRAKAGRKVGMKPWTTRVTHNAAELNMIMPTATADLTENPGTSVKQNKQTKNKESDSP